MAIGSRGLLGNIRVRLTSLEPSRNTEKERDDVKYGKEHIEEDEEVRVKRGRLGGKKQGD